MARRRRGERGRWVGPVVDYPGYPPWSTEAERYCMVCKTARREGSVIQDTEPSRSPRGPQRIARRPSPGRERGLAGRFVNSAGLGVRFRQDASS